MVTHTGPSLSHLLFIDDIVLFAEASIHQMKVIRSCLGRFCAWSGEKVSFVKSSIFFSLKVPSWLCHDNEAVVSTPLLWTLVFILEPQFCMVGS